LFQPKQNASVVKRLSCFSQSQLLSAVCAPSQRLGRNDYMCGYRLWLAKQLKPLTAVLAFCLGKNKTVLKLFYISFILILRTV